MRWLIGLLVVLLIALQYRLWIADGGYAQQHRLQQEIAQQQQNNQLLQDQVDALQKQVKALKNGNEAIIERAREDMGMVGKDETFFRLVDPPVEDE